MHIFSGALMDSVAMSSTTHSTCLGHFLQARQRGRFWAHKPCELPRGTEGLLTCLPSTEADLPLFSEVSKEFQTQSSEPLPFSGRFWNKQRSLRTEADITDSFLRISFPVSPMVELSLIIPEENHRARCLSRKMIKGKDSYLRDRSLKGKYL